jgi:hypothetical protein
VLPDGCVDIVLINDGCRNDDRRVRQRCEHRGKSAMEFALISRLSSLAS